MGVDNPDWIQRVFDDGRTPVDGDPYATGGDTFIKAVEEKPRRRLKVGEVVRDDKIHPVYQFVSTTSALVLDEDTGKWVHVVAGELDKRSNQRIHLDEQPISPWGEITDELDLADVANDRAAVVRRRPCAVAGRIGEKTIGR